MTSTKKSLLTSALALALCFVMLAGSTFAWFTDIAVSKNNVIQSGNLNIALMKGTPNGNGGWDWIENNGEAIFDYDKWEPGYTTTAVLAIENHGSLNATWTAKIKLNGTPTILGDVIDVYVTSYHNYSTDRPDFKDGTWQKLGTVSDILNNDGMLLEGGLIEPGHRQPILVALNMREDAGNEYQGIDLGANFDILVLATQATGESDSFDDKYDENAVADFLPGFQGGSAIAGVTLNDQGATVGEVTMDGGDVSAVIPAGVMLSDGVNHLNLAVTKKNSSDANVQLSENDKMRSLDVHIEGVAPGNTVPILVTLKSYLTPGINTGALKMYHVENGATVVMTQVQNPTNHNEFSYDPATGDVTLAMASFSEVAVAVDTNNPWDGKTLNYLWYNTTDTNLTIYNADQLAAFAAIVDGKAEGIKQDSFVGKTVKLNNNIYLSGKLFDPIGWGYVNTDWNRDVDEDGKRDDGKVFQGTFDGGQYENGKLVGRYTIFDLYQDGWDLESATGTVYTYTNCGFGLFAAASNATFKNLTISGADIRVECVEAGVLVGLSQNNCTYDNIKILNSKIANYQRPAGGLIGEVSGSGTTKITNVTIGEDVVVGSLWGDFDAPVGGVIGAYWDDVDAYPQIEMSYVDVGCRLDVYNDITSAYQWHAYRRAGMLIGNTDMSDPNNAHKAYAPFLKCLKDDEGNDTVKVYYGDWVNYTYCSFSNHNPRYPWVRTQAGENCSAFSNPRWGVPNDANDKLVTDMNHVHAEGDECNVLRQFSQLYGGGQGVYGQDKHDGVTYPNSAYSITYVNDGKTLDVIYVTDNTNAVTVDNDQAKKLVDEWATNNMKDYEGWRFGGWMNAASIKLDKIPENNTKNVVLYPYFDTPYTASFVDQQGNILDWCFFNEKNVEKLSGAFATANDSLPDPGKDFTLIHWIVRGENVNVNLNPNNINWDNFKNYKEDVTITPHYRYKGADLIEVWDELTGEIDHYEVAGYGEGGKTELVEIPDYVNGKPVIKVNDGAFKSYDDLYAAVIPGTITHIGSNAFTEISGSKRDQVTLYYEGKPEDWKRAMDDLYVNKAYSYYTDFNTAGTYTEAAYLTMDSSWDSGAGDGSRVFFLDENGKVDLSKGYWELYREYKKNGSGLLSYGYVYIWIFHDHPYDNTLNEYKNCPNKNTHYGSFTDYDANDRPDKEYWEGVTAQ